VCRAFTLILVVSDSSSLAASAGYRALISSAIQSISHLFTFSSSNVFPKKCQPSFLVMLNNSCHVMGRISLMDVVRYIGPIAI
jgi:hypothetical protein